MKQRLALITLQRAEVTYALTQRTDVPITLLTSVALASEQVVQSLTLPEPQRHPEAVAFPASLALFKPSAAFSTRTDIYSSAESLLRDAQRSTAASYNMLGILYELQGSKQALNCFEKSLWWYGGYEGPADWVPEAEWKAVWDNCVRCREAAK
jgi:hypothetical protein